MCDYKVQKEITLKKHINTKHSRKDTLYGLASNALAASYFCDECEYSCHNKKSLKKHKSHNMKVLAISVTHVLKNSKTRKTLILTSKICMSVYAQTQLSAINACMRMGGSTKTDIK